MKIYYVKSLKPSGGNDSSDQPRSPLVVRTSSSDDESGLGPSSGDSVLPGCEGSPAQISPDSASGSDQTLKERAIESVKLSKRGNLGSEGLLKISDSTCDQTKKVSEASHRGIDYAEAPKDSKIETIPQDRDRVRMRSGPAKVPRQNVKDADIAKTESVAVLRFTSHLFDVFTVADLKSRNKAVKAGLLSTELRQAMGLKKYDLPPYIFNMQRVGYPPGYERLACQLLHRLLMLDEYKILSKQEVEELGVLLDQIPEYPGFTTSTIEHYSRVIGKLNRRQTTLELTRMKDAIRGYPNDPANSYETALSSLKSFRQALAQYFVKLGNIVARPKPDGSGYEPNPRDSWTITGLPLAMPQNNRPSTSATYPTPRPSQQATRNLPSATVTSAQGQEMGYPTEIPSRKRQRYDSETPARDNAAETLFKLNALGTSVRPTGKPSNYRDTMELERQIERERELSNRKKAQDRKTASFPETPSFSPLSPSLLDYTRKRYQTSFQSDPVSKAPVTNAMNEDDDDDIIIVEEHLINKEDGGEPPKKKSKVSDARASDLEEPQHLEEFERNRANENRGSNVTSETDIQTHRPSDGMVNPVRRGFPETAVGRELARRLSSRLKSRSQQEVIDTITLDDDDDEMIEASSPVDTLTSTGSQDDVIFSARATLSNTSGRTCVSQRLHESVIDPHNQGPSKKGAIDDSQKHGGEPPYRIIRGEDGADKSEKSDDDDDDEDDSQKIAAGGNRRDSVAVANEVDQLNFPYTLGKAKEGTSKSFSKLLPIDKSATERLELPVNQSRDRLYLDGAFLNELIIKYGTSHQNNDTSENSQEDQLQQQEGDSSNQHNENSENINEEQRPRQIMEFSHQENEAPTLSSEEIFLADDSSDDDVQILPPVVKVYPEVDLSD
ncbi:unnamed protein product [Orchesella dallaii]|uniref:PSP proline-rich domain-containing protein n=1 Tax=Orchesella dallaii TaxID=48710 RepID=A0ABP1QW14_9HEXA